MKLKLDSLKYFEYYKNIFTLIYRESDMTIKYIDFDSESDMYKWISNNVLFDMVILEIRESKVYNESAICGNCNNYNCEWCNKYDKHTTYTSKSCNCFELIELYKI